MVNKSCPFRVGSLILSRALATYPGEARGIITRIRTKCKVGSPTITIFWNTWGEVSYYEPRFLGLLDERLAKFVIEVY